LKLKHFIVAVTVQQRHANLHRGCGGQLGWTLTQPDGEAITTVQVPGDIIFLAKVLKNVQNLAVANWR